MPVIQFRSPQCVMVRIPKTGSTSIVKGLLGGMENASEIRYGEFPDEWQDLYSFAVVRNPFDRLVSAFVMFQTYPTKTEEEREFQANLTLDQMMDVVESPEYSPALTDYFSRLKLHAIPMSHPFFCMEKVRDVFRFEEFDAAFRKLAETLATLAKLNQSNPIQKVPHFRKSQREDYQRYFTEAQRQRAEAIYRTDLKEFGYSF